MCLPYLDENVTIWTRKDSRDDESRYQKVVTDICKEEVRGARDGAGRGLLIWGGVALPVSVTP